MGIQIRQSKLVIAGTQSLLYDNNNRSICITVTFPDTLSYFQIFGNNGYLGPEVPPPELLTEPL